MSFADKFIYEPQDQVVSQCALCIHKHNGKPTCDAFKKQIPDDILTNKVDHKKAYPGDNGIRFEAR